MHLNRKRVMDCKMTHLFKFRDAKKFLKVCILSKLGKLRTQTKFNSITNLEGYNKLEADYVYIIK